MADTRQIIDYAAQDNAKEMRDALYADIHDRVMGHIDMKKQEIAMNLIKQPEEVEQETPVENT
jgi:hypothetical protein